MENKMTDLKDRPNIKVKIKGDGGEFEVWGIDWYYERVLVYRAGTTEWISFLKCKIIEQ